MASLFSQLFCCGCYGRARSHSPGGNDETSRLIRPDSNPDIVPQPSYGTTHESIKDKLGSIVRAKEGKMVNVSAHLPFNMRNRPHHGQHDTSSSRSHSAQPGGSGVAASSSDLYSYSPTGERDPSPSLETSRSTTSLHPGDASYLPPEADPENGGGRPILGVRLVRQGGFGVGGSFNRGREGRRVTRGRLGRFGEDRGDLSGSETQGNGMNGSHYGQRVLFEQLANKANGNGYANDQPKVLQPSEHTPKQLEETDGNSHPSEVITHQAIDHKIQGSGKISCSWGD